MFSPNLQGHANPTHCKIEIMLGYVLKGKHQQDIPETKHTELKLFTPILLAINAGLKQNTALNFIHKQTTLTSQYIDYFLKGKKRKT